MTSARDTPPDPSAVEFFEKRIRPLLSENCFGCHSGSSKPIQAGLRLDSRAAMLRGGGRGTALTPGAPETSLLIKALRASGAPQMPPKGRMPEESIALLERWVRQGAIWPGSAAAPANPTKKPAFNLKQRAAAHWSWKPVRMPSVPSPRDPKWVRNPIDAFILSKLESRGLRPAPPADKRALIRRVTFDLIGLPPTPAEVEAFLADKSPDAYERVVDRLLASPHYGERWARHWLDLVRYAETYGHEGDYEKPNAYQYRDYVIRALNADVPYNQFVKEHIAGDLIAKPRRDSRLGFNESILGTGFWWLGEGTHSPVDLLQDEADRIDNQIDVFGKAFLGLGLGCARCHDHKFDAISTKDYYALAGFLRSSRYQQTALANPDAMKPAVDALESIAARRDDLLKRAVRGATNTQLPSVPAGATLFDDFNHDTYAGWTATGEAFGAGPRHGVVQTRTGSPGAAVVRITEGGAADSGFLSDRLQGVLSSRTFTIANKRILYHLAGHGAEVRLVLSGLQLIQDPIYGGLRITLNGDDTMHWVSQDVSKWIGYRAHIELADTGPGHLLVDSILFSDQGPPAEAHVQTVGLETRTLSESEASELKAIDTRRAEIEATLPEFTRALAMADGTGENDRVHIRGSYKSLGDEVPRRFLEALVGTRGAAAPEGSGRLALAKQLVDPVKTPFISRVLVNRLWLHHFGEGIVRTPDDFGAMGLPPTHPELLDWLASTFVADTNRQSAIGIRHSAFGIRQSASSHHHIITSSPPHPLTSSPPQGLAWSLKKLNRLMVVSSAYRMSTRIDPKAEQADPTNKLLHRMPIRRLEAEAIRDAVLAVSGRLDAKQFGPSVMPFLSPYMEGRGRPGTSGPLDGDGRRSIYINVRRNFLPSLFVAFDYPVPFTCIGRRSTSNVPAQALVMMNNPFILQQSEVWAKRLLAEPAKSDVERIRDMYMTAFSRPPDPLELSEALSFLAEQPGGSTSPQAWTDLCHVLFNVKEFLFVN